MDDYGIDLTHDAKDRMTGWDRDTNNTSLDSQDWTLSFEADWDDTTLTDGGVGTTQTRTHDAAHQLLTLDPDATGSLPAFSQTHDPKGNLTADGSGRAFTHDFDNMLSSVTVSPGASLGTPGTHSYTYDALGRRVSKTTSGGGGTTTVFTYTGNQVIAEYTAGTAASNPDRKYVYCVTCYIDEPIALIDATGVSEVTYYYHRNRQFSIVGLTDSTGTVIERYAYDGYGDPTLLAADGVTVRTTSSYGNTYLHTGRRYDPESALYYYRTRYYGPFLARFLERDYRGGLYPDGMNSYAAYHVLRGEVDPMGLVATTDYTENFPHLPAYDGQIDDTAHEQKVIIDDENWVIRQINWGGEDQKHVFTSVIGPDGQYYSSRCKIGARWWRIIDENFEFTEIELVSARGSDIDIADNDDYSGTLRRLAGRRVSRLSSKVPSLIGAMGRYNKLVEFALLGSLSFELSHFNIEAEIKVEIQPVRCICNPNTPFTDIGMWADVGDSNEFEFEGNEREIGALRGGSWEFGDPAWVPVLEEGLLRVEDEAYDNMYNTLDRLYGSGD